MEDEAVRCCPGCRRRLTYGADYECPKCGFFDRDLWNKDHPLPDIAEGLTWEQVVAEYEERGQRPPSSLMAKVGRKAAA
jgi:hypothetical protein